jgi:hypothetical protein
MNRQEEREVINIQTPCSRLPARTNDQTPKKSESKGARMSQVAENAPGGSTKNKQHMSEEVRRT